MPDIEFKDLNSSIGTELFADAESFLEDLTDDAVNIVGGISQSNKLITTTAVDRITSHYVLPETTGYFPRPGHDYTTPPVVATAFLPPRKPHHHRPRHHKFTIGTAD
jgi:hypothetical protein